MIESFKKTFAIGMLVILCFLVTVLILKQFLMDEELSNCKDKIQFLEEDLHAIFSPKSAQEDLETEYCNE